MSTATAKLDNICARFISDWRSRDDGSPFRRPSDPAEFFHHVRVEECDYPVAADVFARWDRYGRQPFREMRSGLGRGLASTIVSFPRTDADDSEWCSFAFVLWPPPFQRVTIGFATGEQDKSWGELLSQ